MVRIYRIFLLLLCSFNILLAESVSQNKNHPKNIKTAPFYASEMSGVTHEKVNKELLQQDVESVGDIFTAEEIEEMEFAFEYSPEKAQDIVKYLQDPAYFPCGVNFRAAFFVGEPGSGKTITAKTIAYKMAQKGWEYKIIPSTSFLGEYRNQTAIRFQKELEIATSSNKPTIIVIDELHRLLENANSKHHDTDMTATVLWTFLDKQINNKNFFFIGTMNRANKLPKPFKDRILTGCVPFPLITDSKIKAKLFRKHLTSVDICLDKEITDAFLNQELEKIGPCSGRNLKHISLATLMMYKGNKEKRPLLIKKESIVRAINEYMRNKATMEYDIEDETDEQRQERHHKENMDLQKKHREEQIEIQKENQDKQETHFAQQNVIQLLSILSR